MLNVIYKSAETLLNKKIPYNHIHRKISLRNYLQICYFLEKLSNVYLGIDKKKIIDEINYYDYLSETNNMFIPVYGLRFHSYTYMPNNYVIKNLSPINININDLFSNMQRYDLLNQLPQLTYITSKIPDFLQFITILNLINKSASIYIENEFTNLKQSAFNFINYIKTNFESYFNNFSKINTLIVLDISLKTVKDIYTTIVSYFNVSEFFKILSNVFVAIFIAEYIRNCNISIIDNEIELIFGQVGDKIKILLKTYKELITDIILSSYNIKDFEKQYIYVYMRLLNEFQNVQYPNLDIDKINLKAENVNELLQFINNLHIDKKLLLKGALKTFMFSKFTKTLQNALDYDYKQYIVYVLYFLDYIVDNYQFDISDSLTPSISNITKHQIGTIYAIQKNDIEKYTRNYMIFKILYG